MSSIASDTYDGDDLGDYGYDKEVDVYGDEDYNGYGSYGECDGDQMYYDNGGECADSYEEVEESYDEPHVGYGESHLDHDRSVYEGYYDDSHEFQLDEYYDGYQDYVEEDTSRYNYYSSSSYAGYGGRSSFNGVRGVRGEAQTSSYSHDSGLSVSIGRGRSARCKVQREKTPSSREQIVMSPLLSMYDSRGEYMQWVYRMEDLYAYHHVPERKKVGLALSLFMEERLVTYWRMRDRVKTWDAFVRVMLSFYPLDNSKDCQRGEAQPKPPKAVKKGLTGAVKSDGVSAPEGAGVCLSTLEETLPRRDNQGKGEISCHVQGEMVESSDISCVTDVEVISCDLPCVTEPLPGSVCVRVRDSVVLGSESSDFELNCPNVESCDRSDCGSCYDAPPEFEEEECEMFSYTNHLFENVHELSGDFKTFDNPLFGISSAISESCVEGVSPSLSGLTLDCVLFDDEEPLFDTILDNLSRGKVCKGEVGDRVENTLCFDVEVSSSCCPNNEQDLHRSTLLNHAFGCGGIQDEFELSGTFLYYLFAFDERSRGSLRVEGGRCPLVKSEFRCLGLKTVIEGIGGNASAHVFRDDLFTCFAGETTMFEALISRAKSSQIEENGILILRTKSSQEREDDASQNGIAMFVVIKLRVVEPKPMILIDMRVELLTPPWPWKRSCSWLPVGGTHEPRDLLRPCWRA